MLKLPTLSPKSMLPLKHLQELVGHTDSGVFHELHDIHVSLKPVFLNNVSVGLIQYFNHYITRHHPSIDAIVMKYGKLQIVSPVAGLMNEEANIHINVRSDFYVFRPVPGMIVRGVITKKERSFVSCLILGMFNVPCHKPSGELAAWFGAQVPLGKVVLVELLKVDIKQRVPYLQGKLLDSEVEQQEWDILDPLIKFVDPKERDSFNDNLPASKKAKRKLPAESGLTANGNKRSRLDPDVYEDSLSQHYAAPLSVLPMLQPPQEQHETDKERKKKKAKRQCESVEAPMITEIVLDEETSVKKKKKKKKNRDSDEDAELSQPVCDDGLLIEEVDLTTEQATKKKKKKKKKKEDQDRDSDSNQQLPVGLSVDGIDSGHKSKKKDRGQVQQESVESGQVGSTELETSQKKEKKKKKKKDREKNNEAEGLGEVQEDLINSIINKINKLKSKKSID